MEPNELLEEVWTAKEAVAEAAHFDLDELLRLDQEWAAGNPERLAALMPAGFPPLDSEPAKRTG